MRTLTSFVVAASLLALAAAASACGMEMSIEAKHTLVAKNGAKPGAARAGAEAGHASALKALLAQVDAAMQAEAATPAVAAAEPSTEVAAPEPAADAPEPADAATIPAASDPAPGKKVARR